MSDEERRRLLDVAARHADEYLTAVKTRHVAARATAEEMRSAFDTPLSNEGDDPAAILRSLADHAERGHTLSSSPRFFGFVIGGTFPVAIGADWLTAAWDQNAGLFVLSPLTSVIEEVTARWVCDLLGLPAESSVGFVTGCQMANFTGLAAARHAVLRRVGWNVEEKGLIGAPPIRVITGGESHVTIFAALRMLGLGATTLVAEADDQGRMKADALQRVLAAGEGPAIVCAQAGNVNTGSFDPLRRICEIGHEHGAWVHVDGAFGLWAAASPAYRRLVEGVELAESWATDAHKWLNVPQDSGIVIVRDSAAHRASMTSNAAYLQRTDDSVRDEVDWVPEFSRRARAFPVYATLRALGRRGVAELVESCCSHTRRMVEILARDPRVEVLCDVVLNQALLRFKVEGRDPDDLTRRVIARIQADGTSWFGGTIWQGKGAMRISVINWSTTDRDIDVSASAVLDALNAVLGAAGPRDSG